MKTLNDLTAPRSVVRKLLEKDVQKQCVDWARARGYWARKFSSQSQRSVPDYVFSRVGYEDCVFRGKFATEFKAPGKSSTAAQLEEQQKMRAAGWVVFECDDFHQFVEIVEHLEENGRAEDAYTYSS